jgi:3'-5' exoribonuclease
MKKTFVRDLKQGQRIEADFLVQNKTLKVARNGGAYLDLQLQDSSGVIPAKLWEVTTEATEFETDDLVRVSAGVEDYHGNLQLRIDHIAKCANQELDLRDFLPCSQRDLEEMYARLLERLRRMPEGPLRRLVLAVTEDQGIAEKFKLAPAAIRYHHAYLGGLLEQVVSLVELGDKVSDHYASLDRDLVLAGLVLHDLGKIEELSFTSGFRYSTRGQLVGHMTIALEMVREKMRSIPEFPSRLGEQIEHIILSHHGKPEFGSPKEPMFPEALVVHYLDDLDSKLESMRAQYSADQDRAGDWTNRNRALGRELLKRRAASHE